MNEDYLQSNLVQYPNTETVFLNHLTGPKEGQLQPMPSITEKQRPSKQSTYLVDMVINCYLFHASFIHLHYCSLVMQTTPPFIVGC